MGPTGGGGHNLGKMAKNCMKMTKSAILGQNSAGMKWGRQANISGSWGRSPQSPPVLPPLLVETLFSNIEPKHVGNDCDTAH